MDLPRTARFAARFGALLLALPAAGLLVAACAGGQGGRSTRDANVEPPVAVTPSVAEPQRRARLRLELASAYFEQGRNDIALEELRQALALDPNLADGYSLQGLVYMSLGAPDRAEQSFQRALRLAPGNSDALHNLGYLLCQQGRFEQAQQRFAAVLAEPTYGRREKTLLVASICQVRAGQVTAGEAGLRQVLELNPANPVAGYQLADLLHRRGDAAGARVYLRRINSSDQANAQSLWLGIKVERALGANDRMHQLGDELQRRFPDAPEWIAYQRGRFEE